MVAITDRMKPERREFVAKSILTEVNSLKRELEPLLSPSAATQLIQAR